MNILLIEDELAAAEKLAGLIRGTWPEAILHGPLESIEDSIEFITNQPSPDVIFMDIQLADGHSFEIFREVNVTSPVIFTTAYDQFALEAFQHNGLEYLLKPVKEADFQRAVTKYQRWMTREEPIPALQPAVLTTLLNSLRTGQFQKRLVIRYGQQIKAIDIEEAAYFYLESKVTLMRTFAGKEYPVDQNLEELQALLDPRQFFRINRKLIINIRSITHMLAYSKARVKLTLEPSFGEEAIVSAERSAEFKEWLKGLPA